MDGGMNEVMRLIKWFHAQFWHPMSQSLSRCWSRQIHQLQTAQESGRRDKLRISEEEEEEEKEKDDDDDIVVRAPRIDQSGPLFTCLVWQYRHLMDQASRLIIHGIISHSTNPKQSSHNIDKLTLDRGCYDAGNPFFPSQIASVTQAPPITIYIMSSTTCPRWQNRPALLQFGPIDWGQVCPYTRRLP